MGEVIFSHIYIYGRSGGLPHLMDLLRTGDEYHKVKEHKGARKYNISNAIISRYVHNQN